MEAITWRCRVRHSATENDHLKRCLRVQLASSSLPIRRYSATDNHSRPVMLLTVKDQQNLLYQRHLTQEIRSLENSISYKMNRRGLIIGLRPINETQIGLTKSYLHMDRGKLPSELRLCHNADGHFFSFCLRMCMGNNRIR